MTGPLELLVPASAFDRPRALAMLADAPPVHVLVFAADGELWVGPLGAAPSVHDLWLPCGRVGAETDAPLASAVQAAWAEHWSDK